ncbi:hypothetical protein [Nonomuraea dietziae]|uniref:Uncharacterized protein n=1 Tax=Nonomuraea dietziae TaxID=65515 RepID=A0A7W5VAF2_9ACTN|nr:hypothetical protein [Nonomuraea dietziae]MBB3728130.1 hypothetical protein [Nonomuraea dietziae]
MQTQTDNLTQARLNGSLDWMMTLASELGLTAEDLRLLPHQIAVEIAEGCIQNERSRGYVGPSPDWHALFRSEANEVMTGGLEGLIAYLLGQFYEVAAADMLRHKAACKPPF